MLSSKSSLFLGIELATDQLRATLVDDNLELMGVECVDFDTEVPEYQTQGGIFTTPGDAYTTPVDMWVKGLDLLLEKLHRSHDLTRIRAIGGAAQHALVWWKANAVPNLSSLDSRLNLHSQLTSQCFSIPNVPVAQDTSAHTHALAIEAALGGPDHMAARVGSCAQSSLVAAQLLRVREAWPDVWARTGRVQVASSFLCSMMCGSWVGMNEPEACATGMWVHATTGGLGHWDEGVLEIIGGNREEGRRIRAWLGDVDISGGSRRIGMVGRYMVDRYGFDPDTIVTPFAQDSLASYLSLCPLPSDAVLQLGPMDFLMAPATSYQPSRLYSLYPHPAQDPTEKRRYIVALTSRNADVPRALVRDMYTKSWSAFDRLVDIVPPGGSIGLDDKLFSFWFLQGEGFPFAHVKGIFRFETGIKVNEFRDLRANPRCLLESQVLSFRVRWSRISSTGVFGLSVGRGNSVPNSTSTSSSPTPIPPPVASSLALSLGLTFDPYDYSTLPSRIIATGAAANFPSVVNIIGDILNAPILVPTTQIDGAQIAPHRNAPAKGYPSRGSMGGAYVARWVWGRERGGIRVGGVFEDDIKKVLGKRWMMNGGLALKTNVNAPSSTSASAASTPGPTGVPGSASASRGGSGTNTPFSHHPRSGLGSTVFVEEDEEEDNVSLIPGRMRTVTGSTSNSSASLIGPPTPGGSLLSSSSLAVTGINGQNSTTVLDLNQSPDPSGGSASADGTASTTSAPLTPVTAMTTTSDSDLQIGLAKVTEPDVDSFMGYAAIVPEYCRLEGMLVKGIV